MRILVHDYPGHPFQPSLSRWLANRGHEVLHLFFQGFQTPQGVMSRQADDPDGFAIRGITLDKPFAKYDFAHRYLQEREYGKRLAAQIHAFNPDVILAGNAPLDIQARSLKAAKRRGVPFVYWHQDVYSSAIDKVLRKQLPIVGGLIGSRYVRLERELLRESDHVVTITSDFLPLLESWGVDIHRTTVIENWAPRESLPLYPKTNPWSVEHDVAGRPVALYAGTLGLKHNPKLLVDAARFMQRTMPDARLVVISEGPGIRWIAEHSAGVANLLLLPFQKFEQMPLALAAADVLLVILEPDAGVFSVPSKVLTYLCAGRAIVAAVPAENLAARIILSNNAGLVVDPRNSPAFSEAVASLLDDPARVQEMGGEALEYASKAFDIDSIGARFLSILEGVR